MKKVQEAESFVFASSERQRMRHVPLRSGGVRMTAHAGGGKFEEGIDFEVDYDAGYIARTSASRIPDWSEHALSGVTAFDHTQYPSYTNRDYTVYATYQYEEAEEALKAVDVSDSESHAANGFGDLAADPLAGLREKLVRGGEIVYAVLGDSISAGGDAGEPALAFFGRLAAWIEETHPGCRVTIENRAIGGETSEGGAARVATDIVPLRPDLVTVGYGMNDQNKYEHGNGVPLEDYKRNIRQMVDAISEAGDAAVILVTPCEPNPLWKHTSGQIGEYAEALRAIGRDRGIPVGDAHAAWMRALAAGKTPESLLLNNINHPNNYGHDLYFEAMKSAFNQSKRV
ncbi:SGNH/GDSL hydrolase family protein [Paenibacillus sacheonensis]|uniref:SGNH hydrolase-type esterase domain-containing protein n=1 Tax=Paenibacillus sacheonensis TaxID=742054 RepID=A0A7X5BWJ2_9BACL|nr:SGNH/GDSL hydrolase family protein [Paenibacillus sacheonensis]MBM7564094.1 lysophospholipase L1-like esterase [Paenibacillus sacheonensis]NBC67577.1 hypothetical protein [Paenibacillus sacheonensis]